MTMSILLCNNTVFVLLINKTKEILLLLVTLLLYVSLNVYIENKLDDNRSYRTYNYL